MPHPAVEHVQTNRALTRSTLIWMASSSTPAVSRCACGSNPRDHGYTLSDDLGIAMAGRNWADSWVLLVDTFRASFPVEAVQTAGPRYLRGGQRDRLATTFGMCSRFFVHAALSALDVSGILMHSATAFHVVKLAGACYLVWLGVQQVLTDVVTQPTEARGAAAKACRSAVEASATACLPLSSTAGMPKKPWIIPS